MSVVSERTVRFSGVCDPPLPARIGDLRDLGRQGEDDMEVFHRQ